MRLVKGKTYGMRALLEELIPFSSKNGEYYYQPVLPRDWNEIHKVYVVVKTLQGFEIIKEMSQLEYKLLHKRTNKDREKYTYHSRY